MSTMFVKPEDLMKIRELRLRQEIAQTQAQSHGYAMQAELGRLYLRLGLAADDSINIDTGVITIAHPKPDSDTDIPVGAVHADSSKRPMRLFDELRRHAEKLDSSDHGRSELTEAKQEDTIMEMRKYNSFTTVHSMSANGDLPIDVVRRFVYAAKQKLGATPELCDVDAFTFGKLCQALRCEPTCIRGLRFVKFDGVEFYERAPEEAMNFTFKAPDHPWDDKPGEAQTTGDPTFAA